MKNSFPYTATAMYFYMYQNGGIVNMKECQGQHAKVKLNIYHHS